jgi:uncharacterized membrane protein YkoI
MIKGIVVILAAGFVLLALPETARSADFRPSANEIESVQSTISSRQARSAAERAHPRARAINVRFVDGRRPIFIVRMIQGNRRFDVRVDAQSGRVL